MDTNGLRPLVDEFLSRYCRLLDADRLEDWLALFAEESSYRVVPRENRMLNLPAAILHLANRRMIRDRIVALRTSAVFNPHVGRHLYSGVHMLEADASYASFEANFAVFQSDTEGSSRLFCCGFYESRIRLRPEPRIVEMTAVLDTSSVPTLLAVPV